MVSTKRRDNYTGSRKKNLRKKARYSLRNYIQECCAWNGIDDFSNEMSYLPNYQGPVPQPRFWNIHCNRHYHLTHSLFTLQHCAPDIYLNRTVHISFTKHEIPLLGTLTCISHLGFIRLQSLRLASITANHRLRRFDASHLLSVGRMQNAYWFHLKCIGRVMVYEEKQRRYVDITEMMMDLMKYKVIQWIKSTPNIEDIDIYNEDLKKIASCLSREQDKVNCHALLLKKHHDRQLEQMEFREEELGAMLSDYVRIGGQLRNEESPKRKAKGRFKGWDDEHIEKISRKMCKRTC